MSRCCTKEHISFPTGVVKLKLIAATEFKNMKYIRSLHFPVHLLLIAVGAGC